MNVHDAIRNRRTIHRYATDPLPEGAIERALEAAILAPNHRLTWPWRFVRVGRNTRAGIAELAVQLKSTPEAPCSGDRAQRIRNKILNPAELVVVSVVRHEDPVIGREDDAAVACAIQNFTLSLAADGVGSKWSSGKLTKHPQCYARFGIDPEREEIFGFLWAGIAADEHKAPERPALSTFVRELE